MRRGLRIALLAAALLAPAAAAAAAPATRDAAIAAYRSVVEDEKVDAGWTGSVQGCVVGSESQTSLEATLRTVNTLRSFAGIGAVWFDATFNKRALSAALMMRAANDLSHTPGADWPCYSNEGAMGAGSSNLFLGLSGPAAMVGFVDDEGVGSLGHRRWLIDPGGLLFGSGSTGTTNALYVIGGPRTPVAPRTQVAWPPSGFVPWQWIFKDWSIALGGDLDSGQFETANAQVQVALDGDPLNVTAVQPLDDGYGTGRTLSWNVAVPASATTADHDLQVTIDGVTLSGAPYPISYTVQAIRIPDEAKCNAAKAKLDKAKAKLKKLRQSGASHDAIVKAKKRVKKAKDKVAAAC
jgi:hypothetical protein